MSPQMPFIQFLICGTRIGCARQQRGEERPKLELA
jgi:hypothetical protein